MEVLRTTPDANIQQRVGLRSLLSAALKQRKLRFVLITAVLGYWILYAFSGGMLFYYSFDLSPFLKTLNAASLTNPYFVYEPGIMGVYYSGMVWYVTNHLQVNLLYGPTFFSVVLSALVGLNVLLLSYGFQFRGPRSGLGLSGAASIVPALFSGGCCAIPFGTLLLSPFVSAAALGTFEFEYVLPTNVLSVVLMAALLLYNSKKVGICCVQPDAR